MYSYFSRSVCDTVKFRWGTCQSKHYVMVPCTSEMQAALVVGFYTLLVGAVISWEVFNWSLFISSQRPKSLWSECCPHSLANGHRNTQTYTHLPEIPRFSHLGSSSMMKKFSCFSYSSTFIICTFKIWLQHTSMHPNKHTNTEKDTQLIFQRSKYTHLKSNKSSWHCPNVLWI